MSMKVVRRPIKKDQKLVRYHDVEMRFDPHCRVCNISDGTLLYNIHFWRFTLNKSYKDISKRISEIDPTLIIDTGCLSNHFRYHFPVEKRAVLEVATGSVKSGEIEKRLTKYFVEQVKSRIKPSHELEDLYDRVLGWLDTFEEHRTQSGTLAISKDDLDGFVKLSSELRGILSELNRIRQSDAIAKFCVQGFMSRFVEYLLKGLPEELENIHNELENKIGESKELESIVERLKSGWARRVKDSARLALLETCREFGLK